MNKDEILRILSTYDLTEDEEEYLYMQLYFTEQLNSKGDEQIQKYHIKQKENRDSVLTEIAKVMLSYPIINTILSIGNPDKIKLQSRLNGLVNQKIQSELKYETLKTGQLLKYIGENKNNTNNYINSLGMKVNYNLLPVKQDALDKIINAKVDEKLWSDRLWDNKNQTAADLRKEIKKFLDGETSVNQIEKIIKEKYDSNGYKTKRLVVDNIARVQEGMNDVWREEHSVERVLYLATLCHNTCFNCRQYDGKEFSVYHKPVDLPQHNFCRCTYVNMPYKGWRPSERLDNETKQRVPWQDYEDWLGKLEHNQEIKITKKNVKNDYSVNRKLVNSKDYHNKFENLPLNKTAKENLYMESKKILEHRDGTHYEDLVILDSRTGKEIVSNRSANNDLRTGLTKKDYEKVINHNGDIVLLHNHPGGGRPSIADIMTAFRQENVKASIVVGHDGSVSMISNINRKVNIEKIYNEYYNKYKQLGYESQHAKLKATDDIYNLNVFKYIEK